MTTDILIVNRAVIQTTLESLQTAGHRGNEGVVLWLGIRDGHKIRVTEAYVPEHEATGDYFRIPPKSMQALLSHLGTTGFSIAAQVHSHPEGAFHSRADDRWAIVRHLGALSLVVPHFARDTDVDSFREKIAAFRLNAENVWEALPLLDRIASLIL